MHVNLAGLKDMRNLEKIKKVILLYQFFILSSYLLVSLELFLIDLKDFVVLLYI